jgi:hypothetical protein
VLEPGTQGAHGAITVTRRGGHSAARRIEAASCAEASDGLALIAALALEGVDDASAQQRPTGEGAALGTSAQPARVREPARARATRTSERDEEETAAKKPAEATTPASTETAHAPATVAPAREAASATSADDRDRADGHWLDVDDDASDPLRPRSRMSLLAAGLLASEVQPALQPGAGLSVALGLGDGRAPDFALRLGARFTPVYSERHAQGTVEFGWWSATAATCAGGYAPGARISLHGCVSLELGRLTARGRDTEQPRSEARPWVALGPSALVQWEPLSPLVLGLSLEAPFALVRDRFLLAAESVHRPASLGLRGEFLLGARLW